MKYKYIVLILLTAIWTFSFAAMSAATNYSITPENPSTRILDTGYLPGTTSGALNVNSIGGASYTVPIEVLPGSNGLSPTLFLSYSSSSGSGLAGYGWQIGGMSVISRTGQNYYNDGASRGVELDYNDKFSLDGQRLVLTGGTYGYNEATYQTEVEIFSRAQSQLTSGNGPQKFMVQTKSGLKNQYGSNSDARLTIPGFSEVLNWYITETIDLYGNQINYTYLKDNNMVYPSEITYGPNKIAFSYSERSDVTYSYIKGQKIQQRLLLDRITVSYNNNVVKSYELKYILITDNYNSYSALNELVEFGTGSNRLNSTVFAHQTPANVAMSQTNYHTTHSYITYQSNLFPGDFNGDGKKDFLCLPDASKGAAWTGMKVCYNDVSDNFSNTLSITTTIDLSKLEDLQALDLNGDGKDDVVYELVNAGTSTFYYMLNNGTSFGSPVSITSLTNGANTGMSGKSRRKNLKQENDHQLFGTDYNGDGANDLFINDPSGNWRIYSMVNSSGIMTSSMNQLGSGTVSTLSDQVLTGDFNGDGKADIWGLHDTGMVIYAFSGSSISSMHTASAPSKNHFFAIGDFNSDGKTDAFIFGNKVGSTEYDWANWQVLLSNGIAFETNNITQKKSNLKNDYLRLGDFNGDGSTDLMVTSPNLSWTGTNFYITKNRGTDFHTHNLSSYPTELNNLSVADFDGDGRTDFIGTDAVSSWWSGYKLHKSTGSTSPLLDKIANGLNHLTTIEYTKLSQASGVIYNQGTISPGFPVFNYQGSLPVVSAISVNNGISGNNTMGYSYEGAKVHRQGKGFLCYTKTKVTDATAVLNTETLTDYDATYFYPKVTSVVKTFDYLPQIVTPPGDSELSGQSESLEISGGIFEPAFIPGTTTLETTTNTWQHTVINAGTKRIFPYIESSTVTDNRSTHSLTTSVSSIDSYGNPTQIVKNFGDGETETTVTNYTNTVSSTDWKLGLVSTSTVTYAKSGETSVSQAVRFTYAADGIMQPDFIYYYEGTPLEYYKNHNYDSKGNITQIYTNGGSIGASQVNYTYDTNGIRLLTATDVLGVTTNTYDTYGRLYTETDYLNNVVTYLYDGLGRRSSVSGTLGSQATISYIWSGTNKPSLAVYGISQTQNTGMVEIAWYDNLQRVVRTEKKGFDGQMILTDTEYNSLGEISRVSDPYFAGGISVWSETYTYNQRLLTDITRNTGRNTHFSYSTIRVTETTAGQTTWKETNSRGLLTRAHDNGGDIVYSYFPDGKLKTIENPGSVFTTMQYADAARNQTQLNDPSASIINYTYNSLGQIKTITNARSQVTTYNYHPDGRIDTVVSPEGTTSYTYNASKQLTGISSPNSVSRTYGYDTNGRVNSVGENIAGSGFSTSFTFDSYGRLGTLTHPSGIVETLGYNSYGYYSTISAGGATRFTVTNMNARLQLTSATYGSNLLASFGFDAYGYPSSTATGSVQDYRYVFDPVQGNLSSRQNYKRSKSESFTYNDLDCLTSVTGPQNLSMTFGSNGNLYKKSDIGATGFGYGTNAGPYALTSVTSSTGLIPTTDQSVSYTSFEKASLITEGVYSASLIYNSNHQRAKMTVTQNGSTILTRWYSGSRYMKETAGAVTKEYTYLGGDAYTAPIAAVTQSGTTNYFYLLRDHLGNITHQVNTSNAVVAEYNFDAWGRRRSADDWSYTLDGNDLALFAGRGFTGHEHLPWFNLYNMNGRMYDPLVARFLSPDQVIQNPTSTQNYNRYSYCLNNPLKYTDPSGYKYFPHIDSELGGQFVWFNDLSSFGRNARSRGNSLYQPHMGTWNYNSSTETYYSRANGTSMGAEEFSRAVLPSLGTQLPRNTNLNSFIANSTGNNIMVDSRGIYIWQRAYTDFNDTHLTQVDARWRFIPGNGPVAQVGGGGFSSSSVSATGVLLQIGDNVSTLYNHDTYRQTNGKIAPIRKPNGQLRTSQQAQRAIRGSRVLKLGSIASNGFMAYNGASSYSENGLTLRNGLDMGIGTLGTICGVALLVSNPVGWVAGAYIAVGAVSAIYGTATTGYDIYYEINGD